MRILEIYLTASQRNEASREISRTVRGHLEEGAFGGYEFILKVDSLESETGSLKLMIGGSKSLGEVNWKILQENGSKHVRKRMTESVLRIMLTEEQYQFMKEEIRYCKRNKGAAGIPEGFDLILYIGIPDIFPELLMQMANQIELGEVKWELQVKENKTALF